MKFKLDFEFPSHPQKVKIDKPLLLVGSCFAEHMADRLRDLKWNICLNPNGIVFNPISIFNALIDCAQNNVIPNESIAFNQHLWHSWEHHGRFSSSEKDTLIHQITEERNHAHQTLMNADYILITLGSAWVYSLTDTNRIVANCHKYPSSTFKKYLLTEKEIEDAFDKVLAQPLFKNKKIIFTVSPVRYIKDGLIENNLSKAVLLRAVNNIVSKHQQAKYFPAYEIVIDELRDYRFFEIDMVHPNKLAIDYVFERFKEYAIDQSSIELMEEIEEVKHAFNHRPFNPETPAHQAFLANYLTKVIKLKERFPYLNFEQELEYFSKG